ncbi:hypothetical protein V6N13_008122 [Hibiscus sabdariffa]|uniref:Uncharacterized protein n=1 Tax=Hibiscus sabdariffa TaxID=183260 RepID=A0ABR2EC95_9ROSI
MGTLIEPRENPNHDQTNLPVGDPSDPLGGGSLLHLGGSMVHSPPCPMLDRPSSPLDQNDLPSSKRVKSTLDLFADSIGVDELRWFSDIVEEDDEMSLSDEGGMFEQGSVRC